MDRLIKPTRLADSYRDHLRIAVETDDVGATFRDSAVRSRPVPALSRRTDWRLSRSATPARDQVEVAIGSDG